MSVNFNSAELARLARALEMLLSPLAHESLDSWRSAINAELREILHADSAGFLMPTEEGLILYSEEHDPAELARYPDYPPPPMIDGTSLWETIVRSQVVTLANAYGEHYGLYLNSPYYQEYAGANGAHDTLAIGASLGGTDARSMACLHFWHERPDGRLFGQREVTIMKLLFPAFRAGVETQFLWGKYRADLLGTLETLGQAVLVCDRMGRALHHTHGLAAILGGDPEGSVLRAEMLAAANAVAVRLRIASTGVGRVSIPPVIVKVKTALACYTLRASLHGGPPAGDTVMILVAIERCTPVPRSDEALREAYGLTKAEARVARLIGQGRSNAEIAETLYISPHTARRHTERILMKMRVRSRAEVGPLLY